MNHQKDHLFGEIIARFKIDPESRLVSFSLIPKSKLDDFVPSRETIDGVEKDVLVKTFHHTPGRELESCIQLKLRGDIEAKAFAGGRTMRNSSTTLGLKWVKQEIIEEEGIKTVKTFLSNAEEKFEAVFILTGKENSPYLEAKTEVKNIGDSDRIIEMLSSFCIDDLTPFDSATGRESLHLHRFRSVWSQEGRQERTLLEDLSLERSWSGYAMFSERYGSVGSMPVKGFFPFIALEDSQANVFWGAKLAHPCSWQMECYRRFDNVSLSGGIADREFGHWWKTIKPEESFQSPIAYLSCIDGTIEDLCDALNAPIEDNLNIVGEEDDLPTIYNEWCTSWGNPTHEDLIRVAETIKDTGIKYLVIDDGWAERPGDEFQQNGDWNINTKAFPEGLKATCDEIKSRGLKPGIWFEFEVCNEGSKAFDLTEHHIQRDGATLQIGTRRFWDFRDPWVFDYLSEKVIKLLKENGFEYLKVDYNETLGIGCDEPSGTNSPGEGLRQQMMATQAFFKKIRKELPHIVIENCSSGGHRHEPSMLALTSMSSVSDAHETVEIPIIAASVNRLIPARQNQIWAVIKAEESLQRITYSLSSNFLGRSCISGDLSKLSEEKRALIIQSQSLYRKVVPIIRRGKTKLIQNIGKSWRTPEGFQIAIRQGIDSDQILIVAHTFGGNHDSSTVTLPHSNYNIQNTFGQLKTKIKGDQLTINFPSDFTAGVLHLE